MIRIVIVALIGLLPYSVLAQNSYTIQGKIGKEYASNTVYLRYTQQGVKVTDSARVKRGKYRFKGQVLEPIMASITGFNPNNSPSEQVDASVRRDYLYFYLENSKISIESDSGLRNSSIKGSKTEEENRLLTSWRRPYKRVADSLVAAYQAMSAEEKKDPAFGIRAKPIMEFTLRGYDSVSRAFIAAFPQSHIALLAFNEIELGYNFDPDSAESRFQLLAANLRNSPTGKKLAETITIGKNTNIGRVAPDISQPDTAGKPVRLSDFRGKYVLLEFWASWCVPCRAENPNLLKAYHKFKDKGFDILGVSLDDADARAAWLGAVKQDNLPWTQISELNGFKSAAALTYGIKAIPSNFLIDPNGRIVAKNLRGEQLQVALKSLLGGNDGFQIDGEIPAIEHGMAYLALVRDGAYRDVDSAAIVNGRFTIKGNLEHPEPAVIRISSTSPETGKRTSSQKSLFLENSAINVISASGLEQAYISGSASDSLNRELEQSISVYSKKISGIYEIASSLSESEKKNAADSVRAWVAQIKALRTEFAEQHVDKYIGLYQFNTFVLDNKFDPILAAPLFERFTEDLKQTRIGQEAGAKINSAKNRQTGILAQDFTQNDQNGKAFTLSDLRGKYVLIDFWASWCAPCRAENPHLVKAYERFKSQNFEIVGISLDNSKAAWINAIEQDGLPWIHVSDLKGWKNEVATLYDIRSVPQNFLIDPEGKIIAKNLRGDQVSEVIAELLK